MVVEEGEGGREVGFTRLCRAACLFVKKNKKQQPPKNHHHHHYQREKRSVDTVGGEMARIVNEVQGMYTWVIQKSTTLQGRLHSGENLSPRLELRSYPTSAVTYDTMVRFFEDPDALVPITALPERFRETLAQLVESDFRTEGFAVIEPATPGSSILACRNFVWDRDIVATMEE